MTSYWRLFTNAGDATGARVVAGRVLKRLMVSEPFERVAPYEKGGFVVDWRLRHADDEWSGVVVAVLASAQAVGTGWMLSGNIRDGLDLWCSEVGVPGATALRVSCTRDSTGTR